MSDSTGGKRCPYCHQPVTVGVFCSGCNALYLTSCTSRADMDPQGRFKCCTRKLCRNQLNSQRSINTQRLPDSGNSSRSASPDVDAEANTSLGQQYFADMSAIPSAQAPIIQEFNKLAAWIKETIENTNNSLMRTNQLAIAANTNVQSPQTKVQTCEGLVDSHTEDIKNINIKISQLSAQLDRLGVSNSQSGHNNNAAGTSAAPSSLRVDDLAAELQDRLRRSQNLIIYDLPMSPDVSDLDMVKDILARVENINIQSIHVRRFTKPTRANSPPPILITFSSAAEVGRVLRNWKLLAREIRVTADHTKSQRTQYNTLRREAERHKAAHPNNKKVVRYVNGVPNILDSKN